MVYARFRQCIFKNKINTWRLVLLRRTVSHSSRSSSDNVSRPCDDSDFITPPCLTSWIFTSELVDTKGPLSTENRNYIPFLTSTAYKTLLYDGISRVHAV